MKEEKKERGVSEKKKKEKQKKEKERRGFVQKFELILFLVLKILYSSKHFEINFITFLLSFFMQ